MAANCKSLTELTISDGWGVNLSNVSNMCRGCDALTSVSLPDNFAPSAQTAQYMFAACTSLSTLTLPEGFASNNNLSAIGYMLSGCTNLHTLNLPSGGVFGRVTNRDYAFSNCTSLSTITGSLNLGVSFDLHYCPLTHESLLNVLNSIQTVTTKPTLTLGTNNLSKLTDDEKKIATDKGWILA